MHSNTKFNLLLLLLFPSFIFSSVDFCVFTCPKCGTHFLTQVVRQVTGLHPQGIPMLSEENNLSFVENAKRTQAFVYTHKIADWQFQELASKNYKFIFIYRDPRDQLISLIYWLPYLPKYPPSKIQDSNQLIEELITGNLYGLPAYEYCIEPYFKKAQQISSSYILMVRFEDLIGPKGGGSLKKQIKTIKEIADFLEIQLTEEQAQEIGDKAWGLPGTFRKGTIGQWKDYFNLSHIQLYKERYGQLLIELDYEKDFNW